MTRRYIAMVNPTNEAIYKSIKDQRQGYLEYKGDRGRGWKLHGEVVTVVSVSIRNKGGGSNQHQSVGYI